MLAEAPKCLLGNGRALTQIGQNSRAALFTLPGCIHSCHWINRVKKKEKQLPKTLLGKRRARGGGRQRKKKEQSRVERAGCGKHAAGMTRVWLSSQGMKNSTSQTRRGSGCLLRQQGKGCTGTTNVIIFMPALLFVRTGTHLRTWVYWLYDTWRAFGVNERRPAGSHYPSQIDFSFVFPSK